MSFGKLVTTMLEDSEKSLMFARDEMRKGDKSLALYYSRMVFFTAWSALEGWINYVSESFATTDKTLSEYEIAFLREKRIQINDVGQIEITNRDAYEPTLRKLVFVLRKFGVGMDLKQSKPELWRELKKIERIRHSIVHPKNRADDLNLALNDAERCFDTVKKTVGLVKINIFNA